MTTETKHPRATDSDVRCSLLLAAVRAFQAVSGVEGQSLPEDQLLVEFAEPVVIPDALRAVGRS
jgi:hypothetical protein